MSAPRRRAPSSVRIIPAYKRALQLCAKQFGWPGPEFVLHAFIGDLLPRWILAQKRGEVIEGFVTRIPPGTAEDEVAGSVRTSAAKARG